MTENEEDQIYSELSQENVNKERERLVECKKCERIISTWMRAPKCMICHSELITVVKFGILNI